MSFNLICRSIDTSRGFCSVQSLLLIGLLATLLFSFGFLSFVAQSKMQFRTTCLKNSIELQRQIIISEKTLFALNPLSTALQLKFALLSAQIIAATLANNYPLAASLEADRAQIYLDQLKLDRLQKLIINSSQILTNASLLQLNYELNSGSMRLSNLWRGFLDIFFVISIPNKTQVAIKAATSGIAPNYELNSQYKTFQKVAFVWQMKYLTRQEQQKLVNTENKFKMSCQSIPNFKGGQWNIEI